MGPNCAWPHHILTQYFSVHKWIDHASSYQGDGRGKGIFIKLSYTGDWEQTADSRDWKNKIFTFKVLTLKSIAPKAETCIGLCWPVSIRYIYMFVYYTSPRQMWPDPTRIWFAEDGRKSDPVLVFLSRSSPNSYLLNLKFHNIRHHLLVVLIWSFVKKYCNFNS